MQQIVLILSIAATSILLNSWTSALRLDKSTADFNHALTSTSVVVTSDRPTAADSTYYFTMTLPDQAGAGFKQLSFTEQRQQQGSSPIQFNLATPEAFVGTPEASISAVDAEAWIDETGTFWVEFDSPVSAGTTLTVAFKANQLPSSGVHEYGIAAYPATGTPVAIYVGNGTLTIH